MSDILSQLSDIQRSAASSYSGPSLIIAGAGSGKTRVMTYRIAYMIEQGIDPSSILALTFTKKAAGEMSERIAKVVNPSASRRIVMGTFHSVFSRILRAEAEFLGFPQSFVLYDTSDSLSLVKTIIKEMNLNDDKYKPKEIFSRISLFKNSLVTPQMYLQDASAISEDTQRGRGEFGNVYRSYMARCKANGAMDFDDLLLYTNILFHNNPEALKKYQQVFKYILVDEYQDTNMAQYLVIKKLSSDHQNICVVGDDAQSIYSFRGAKIENILRFQQDYPSAQVFKLEQNYRSTQTIVSAAASVIRNNSRQLKKSVFSLSQQGEQIALRRSYTEKEEAATIVSSIAERATADNLKWNEFAILYRTNAQSRALEDTLRTKGIPYRIYGGISFYQRKEIKSMTAYIRLILNPNDDEAFGRVLNFPPRGIGDTSKARIAEAARATGKSMFETICTASPAELGIRGVAVKKIGGFITTLQQLRGEVERMDAAEFVANMAYVAGISSHFRDDPTPESQSAYENIEELIALLKQQSADAIEAGEPPIMLSEWIQNITLLTDMDSTKDADNDKVVLMTIHSAKGLEFDSVYIAGMEEGLFPSPRTAESVDSLEEERRLFYVAITRAVRFLMISFSLNRYRHGQSTPAIPSRFIKEIDSQYIDKPELLSQTRAIEDTQSNSWGEKPLFKRFEPKGTTPSTPPRSTMGLKRVASTAAPTEAVNSVGELKEGSLVEHARFGKGKILSLEKAGDDVKATIDFGVAGQKTLLLKFAKLKVIG